jgi:tRNA/tmRNA/rRNA uracil-C5-methylase (TrmA/RlmC/RlmD family)
MGEGSMKEPICSQNGRTAWLVGDAMREWADLQTRSRAEAIQKCRMAFLSTEPLAKEKFRKVQGYKNPVYELKLRQPAIRLLLITEGLHWWITHIVLKPKKNRVTDEAETAWNRWLKFKKESM